MTYCVGIKVNEGLVFVSDSRTNAGVDRISTFQKMFVFEHPGDRVFVLLTAGNLSVTQSVVSLLQRQLGDQNGGHDLMKAETMFAAARTVGAAMRDVIDIDGPALKAEGIEYDSSIILGGQVKGGEPRLYQIYSPGNFIEATADTQYFQIGEVKYGKPVLDRILSTGMPLDEAAKCALISMDSTIRSNLSVGPPFDIVVYRTDALEVGYRTRLDVDDPYFVQLRGKWGDALKAAFQDIANPAWKV